MDQRLNHHAQQKRSVETASDLLPGNLFLRSESQFLAQIPELAVSLLHLSQEFECSLMGLSRTLRLAETMRGWHVLESLARDSLHERARVAAQTRAEQDLQKAKEAAHAERPMVPRRTIESKIKSQAMKALEDPGVLNALRKWTQARNTQKS